MNDPHWIADNQEQFYFFCRQFAIKNTVCHRFYVRSSIIKLFLIVGYAVLIEGFVLISVFLLSHFLTFYIYRMDLTGHNKSPNDSLAQTILFEVK